MASARAFGILNNQNQANGNQFVGKNIQSLKGSEPRSGAAFALKDLTNNNKSQQRTIVYQDGKGKSSSNVQGKQLKATTNSILQKIGVTNEPAAASRKPPSFHSSFDVYSPQYAEFGWGQASCLRDDLLEQMIDFNGVPCDIKRKPLPPVRPDPLDLPDLDDELWHEDNFRPSKEHRFSSIKSLDLPADDFPLVDIQDLEFIF
ncbi:uncharacterized protein LOC126565425 [Anopheles maculipalpis]|uniref:uncharacterized protein LOC126565425 n=1 Tax=Anopheles maculipalpis TaxID=1496333 RepID=UPI002159128C|nr:uncharacterized protein LOC126565425 [Anopheles maculipalpis]